MSGRLEPAFLWLGPAATKCIQLQMLSSDGYELSLREGSKTKDRVDIRPEQFRAVLQDYYHFSSGRTALTYHDRHVIFRIDGDRWASVADVDLMRLENFALAGAGTSIWTGLNSTR